MGTELWLGLDGRSLWDEEGLSMGGRSWVDSSGLIPAELDWAADQPTEDPSLQCVHTDGAGLLVGVLCLRNLQVSSQPPLELSTNLREVS